MKLAFDRAFGADGFYESLPVVRLEVGVGGEREWQGGSVTRATEGIAPQL